MKKIFISFFINIVTVFTIINIAQNIIFSKTSYPNETDTFITVLVLLIVVYLANYFVYEKVYMQALKLKDILSIPIAILVVGLYYFYSLDPNATWSFATNEQDYFLYNIIVTSIAFGASIFITFLYPIINFLKNKK